MDPEALAVEGRLAQARSLDARLAAAPRAPRGGAVPGADAHPDQRLRAARVPRRPLYHLDLVASTREEREAKTRRYGRVRPGLRLGGLPLNAAYYLPELRPDASVAPVPPDDEPLLDRVAGAEDPGVSPPPELRCATREEVDAYWADAPLPEPAYAARIELGAPPHPVAGEVGKLDVVVTNTGTATWPVELPEIRIAYRFEGDDRAGSGRVSRTRSRPAAPSAFP